MQHGLPRQPLCPLPGAIGVPLEVIDRVGPLLAGLDATHYEARRNQSTIGLHTFYKAEELLHLLHVSTTWLL